MTEQMTKEKRLRAFTPDTVKHILETMINGMFAIDTQKIHGSSRLGDDFNLDSLDELALIHEAERAFHITIMNFRAHATFQDLLDACIKQLADAGRLAGAPQETNKQAPAQKPSKREQMVVIPRKLWNKYTKILDHANSLAKKLKHHTK